MAETWFALTLMVAAAALLCSLVVYFNSGDTRNMITELRGTAASGDGEAGAAAA